MACSRWLGREAVIPARKSDYRLRENPARFRLFHTRSLLPHPAPGIEKLPQIRDVTQRRFPPRWSVEELDACACARLKNRRALSGDLGS